MAEYSTEQLLEWYLQGDHEVAISHGLTQATADTDECHIDHQKGQQTQANYL